MGDVTPAAGPPSDSDEDRLTAAIRDYHDQADHTKSDRGLARWLVDRGWTDGR